MSIQSNFPALKPTLLLDFANVKALDPRITFTRASEGRYYDGRTFAKAEENLLTYSQQFDNVIWAKSGASVTADAGAAPDGTTTADLLYPSSTGSWRIVFQGASAVNQVNTFSVFAKASGMSWIAVGFSAGTSAVAWFDLTNGVVGTKGANITSHSIVSVGSGWYRCIVTFTPTTSYSGAVAVTDADNSATGTASGTNGVLLWGAQLEQRSSVTAYTATTTQPITNYIPVLMTAASGVARFDHNPVTEESLGLLIEEQRTNLLTYSEQFDNAAWSKTRSSITANTIVAPDGTLTGDKLVEDATANSSHFVQQTFNFVSGTTYTFCVYAKAAERTSVRMALPATAFGVLSAAFFNIQNGTVSSSEGNITATSVTSVGNGWYRIGFSAIATASVSASNFINLVSSGTTTYTGDGWSGIYIWGAQLEAGAFATSYIPTVAAQVTRSADAASMTGTNFSSWYRPDEGTVYSEWNSAGSQGGGNLIAYSISDNTFDNTQHLIVATTGASNQTSFSVRSGAATSASIVIAGAYTNYSYRKAAAAYQVNNFAAAADGGAVVTDTSGNVPYGVNCLYIGASWIGSSNFLNGTIKKFAFYPARLTNAQLQALTS